jgi:hypothetical protein
MRGSNAILSLLKSHSTSSHIKRAILNCITASLRLQFGIFLWGILIPVLHSFSSPICATRFARRILPELVRVIIYVTECKSYKDHRQSYKISHIFLLLLFIYSSEILDVLVILSCLNICKIADKIINKYTLQFLFISDMKRESKNTTLSTFAPLQIQF